MCGGGGGGGVSGNIMRILGVGGWLGWGVTRQTTS